MKKVLKNPDVEALRLWTENWIRELEKQIRHDTGRVAALESGNLRNRLDRVESSNKANTQEWAIQSRNLSVLEERIREKILKRLDKIEEALGNPMGIDTADPMYKLGKEAGIKQGRNDVTANAREYDRGRGTAFSKRT